MRLLTKSEVQQELAVERKMQIDEGIALARKVDGLRQTAGSEEAVLEQFRTGTTSVVLQEVNDLIEQRNNLKIEVRSLEEQCTTALDPLHTKEAEVDKKLEALEKGNTQLVEREEVVRMAEASVSQMATETSRERGTVDSMLESAEAHLAASKEIFLSARIKEERVNDDLSVRESKVLGREHSVAIQETGLAARERDVSNRLASFKERERALATREQEIADREQTYKRNIERDGKRSTGRE